MPFRLRFLFAGIALAACSPSHKTEDTCSDYTPPPTFDTKTPVVSFKTDVMPIFKGSCAFTACHGLQGSNNGVYLGDDVNAVHESLFNRRSAELPTMPFVTASDPAKSYLQKKIDGSQCILDAQCVDKTCGLPMPKDDDMLPLEMRDTIRRWIAQGAKND
jgi:hypothetical protein